MSPRRRKTEIPKLVDARLEEAEALYVGLLAKAADRRFPLESVGAGFSPASLVELAPLPFLLGRDLAADAREANARRPAA